MGHRPGDVQAADIDHISEFRDCMMITGIKRFTRRSKPSLHR